MSDILAHTLDEAAKRLSISRSAIYSAAARGEIKISKIGRRSVILEQELARFTRELMGETDK